MEVVSFMKWEQNIFLKEAVSFILWEQDILLKEVLSFILKKHDKFLKEVVSFLKKLLVSRKHKCSLYIYCNIYSTSHNLSYVIFIELKIEQKFKKICFLKWFRILKHIMFIIFEITYLIIWIKTYNYSSFWFSRQFRSYYMLSKQNQILITSSDLN